MKEKIIEFLNNMLNAEENENKINIKEDLDLSEIGLTSINMINLIVYLEDTFDFDFDDDELLLENLNTVTKIEECVNKTLLKKVEAK